MGKSIQLFIGVILFIVGVVGLIFYYRITPFQTMPMFMGRGMEGMMDGMMGGRGMMRRMMMGMMRNMEEIDKKTEFTSTGERIFFRGIDSKGGFMKNSHGMQGVGCAMCHGSEAQGTLMMMVDVPPLRWEYLTRPGGHTHSGGRSPPPFTEASFKSCVLTGIDPAGNALSAMMPRWEMSGEDLDGLIEYLKAK